MELTVYLICLGVGFLFTLVSAVFGHLLGGGHDGHVDGSGGHAEAGADTSDMPGVSAFSPTIIACFVTAFGGFGIIFHKIPATNSPFVSAPLAVLCGLGIAYTLLWILNQMFKHTQSSSESKLSTVAGVVAHVVSPIPKDGVGEIAYVQNGSRYTAPARETDGRPVSSGQAVKIVRVIGSQFYVSLV